MGTRSLTVVKDEDGNEILTLYRQFDGYLTGHGRDLAKFLKGFKICNGIADYKAKKMANGPGCLAAQIVAHFKRPRYILKDRQSSVGLFYIEPTGSRHLGEEFIYTVVAYPNQEPLISVRRTRDDTLMVEGKPGEIQRKIRRMVQHDPQSVY